MVPGKRKKSDSLTLSQRLPSGRIVQRAPLTYNGNTLEPLSCDRPVLVVRPESGWIPLNLKEVWKYRELLYFLVWRDVKVKYKQTVLGALWAILQPLLTMVVFTVFFGRMAKVGSDGFPYPIFSYAALLPWILFAQGVSQSADSLVGSSNLVRRVYFPRAVIPVSSVVSGLVDFGLAFLVLIAMMAFYGVHPGIAVLWLPALVLICVLTSLGVGMWLSALNVEYRDVRYVVPFFLQLWLFVTPVIYPASGVVSFLEGHGVPMWMYGLNPMVGVVEGFRRVLLGGDAAVGPLVITGVAVSALLLLTGAYYFRRMERTFADVV
jgi:lipopolysaccharide transport system permease protein